VVGDDDGPYFGEPNPFAEDEPEWLVETSAPEIASTHSAPAPVAVDTQAKSEVPAEAETVLVESAAPAVPAPAFTEPPEMSKRTARIVFRRSRSLDADRRRLFDLVHTLSEFEGEDNFEIVVEANGSERYQLDFPNNRTKICRELTAMLDQRVGPGAWTVHPAGHESSA
jgi:hypothetical protein